MINNISGVHMHMYMHIYVHTCICVSKYIHNKYRHKHIFKFRDIPKILTFFYMYQVFPAPLMKETIF